MNNFPEFMQRMIDANTLGGCEFFDEKPWIYAANQLVAADDPIRALQLLELLPGRYRDNCPSDIIRLKQDIKAKLATPSFYASNKEDHIDESASAKETIERSLRGQKILEDVEAYNKQGVIPHIVDFGPGTYWLPLGLAAKRALFTYSDIGLCGGARQQNLKYLEPYLTTDKPKDRPTIFVACEIIEHLHYEDEIAVECYKTGLIPNVIHISTPLYSFDGRNESLNWRDKVAQPHLRTYTPDEFFQVVRKMFTGYEWEFFPANIMHIRGTRKDGTANNS